MRGIWKTRLTIYITILFAGISCNLPSNIVGLRCRQFIPAIKDIAVGSTFKKAQANKWNRALAWARSVSLIVRAEARTHLFLFFGLKSPAIVDRSVRVLESRPSIHEYQIVPILWGPRYESIAMSLRFLLAVTFLALAAAPAADQDNCANLAKQKYDKVTITSAVFMNDPLGFLPPKTPGMFGTPAGHEGYGAVLPGGRIYRAGAKFAHRFRSLAAARGQMEQQILWPSAIRLSKERSNTRDWSAP